MAFTCFTCHMREQRDGQTYLDNIAVARDAEIDGRAEEARAIRLRAASYILGTADYHLATKQVGDNESWPGETVWLPSVGVSVGPCEDCDRTRPCVNV